MATAASEPMSVTRHTPFEALPQFLTAEEVCAFLSLGRSLVYEMLRDGRLEAVRFGRAVRDCAQQRRFCPELHRRKGIWRQRR